MEASVAQLEETHDERTTGKGTVTEIRQRTETGEWFT